MCLHVPTLVVSKDVKYQRQKKLKAALTGRNNTKVVDNVSEYWKQHRAVFHPDVIGPSIAKQFHKYAQEVAIRFHALRVLHCESEFRAHSDNKERIDIERKVQSKVNRNASYQSGGFFFNLALLDKVQGGLRHYGQGHTFHLITSGMLQQR
jgi:hypothetical protein